MNRRILFSSITSLVGAGAILILAFAFDGLIEYLKVINARTFAVTPILLWVYPLSDLVLAMGLLLLFWYINFRATIHPFVYILLLAVGLLTLLYLPMAPLLSNLLALPLMSTLRVKLIYSAAFIAVAGLFGIMCLRQKSPSIRNRRLNEVQIG